MENGVWLFGVVYFFLILFIKNPLTHKIFAGQNYDNGLYVSTNESCYNFRNVINLVLTLLSSFTSSI